MARRSTVSLTSSLPTRGSGPPSSAGRACRRPTRSAAPVRGAQRRQVGAAAGSGGPDVQRSATSARCRGSPCSRSRPPRRLRRRCSRCRALSCEKWQSTHCMPSSTWIDDRCTAFLNLSDRRRDDVAGRVEQVALAVALEHGAEVPAVAVVVGELRVLQLRVEVRDLLEEVDVAPQAARRRRLGIAVEDRRALLVRRVLLLLRPHRGASDS